MFTGGLNNGVFGHHEAQGAQFPSAAPSSGEYLWQRWVTPQGAASRDEVLKQAWTAAPCPVSTAVPAGAVGAPRTRLGPWQQGLGATGAGSRRGIAAASLRFRWPPGGSEASTTSVGPPSRPAGGFFPRENVPPGCPALTARRVTAAGPWPPAFPLQHRSGRRAWPRRLVAQFFFPL